MNLQWNFNERKENLFWLIGIVVLIIIATSVRYTLLDTHFSHYDDNIISYLLKFKSSNSFSEIINYAERISNGSTYAPLQFILTGSISNSEMSYNDILFWTRLPSLIMTFLSFIIIIFISKQLYKNDFLCYSIISIFIIGFSWEDIIYSVQAEPYTIGLLAVVILFFTFFFLLKKEVINKLTSISIGIILSILIFANYQVLFFLPGFFTALYCSYVSKENKTLNDNSLVSPLIRIKKNLTTLTFAMISFLKDFYLALIILCISFVKLFNLFLSRLTGKGLNWNKGPNNEYFFDTSHLHGYWERIQYSILFFIKNSIVTFNSIVSIAQTTSILNHIYVTIVFILFAIGIRSFYKSQQYLKRNFIYLFITTMLVWLVLIILKKITLSPTRHSLTLLSFVIIFSAEGAYFLLQRIKNKTYLKQIISSSFILFFLLIFFSGYGSIAKERLDKFHPKKIEAILKKYDVSEIYAYDWTANLSIMKYVSSNFSLKASKMGSGLYLSNTKNNRNILFITHRGRKINDEFIKEFTISTNKDSLQDYEILFMENISSKIQIDFSDKTKNGTNSLLYYIIKPNWKK